MTNILNEMICGSVNFSEDNIQLTGDMKITKDGVLQSINSGLIYDVTDAEAQKKYIGAYTIKPDINEQTKRSISININELELMAKVATAIDNMIKDIESKYAK